MKTNRFPTLKRLIARHEKLVDAFADGQTKFFHPYALTLARRIKQDLPEFSRARVSMGRLYLEPEDLPIPFCYQGETHSDETLGHLPDYLDNNGRWDPDYDFVLSKGALDALAELYALAMFIDDPDSMVGGLDVTV